ncbi:hypothetical protein CLOM_g5092 [Closterium sp. NIES-68]|nr:hypothetical protein CLOM_g5092 [Closterium sp. NIES-68]GJP79244.1 hypothetical protein CLOP_g9499 [Closterium sp. NIES-67]
MAARKPSLFLLTLFLPLLLFPLAAVRAFSFDCENEHQQYVSVLSFCNDEGSRYTCLFGGGYATDGSGECTLVQPGALYCEDCQGNLHPLPRCCEIDLSGYTLSTGEQSNTDVTEFGIEQLNCPANTGCSDSGYLQCNEGEFDGVTPYYRNPNAFWQFYCADSSSGVQLRELERPQGFPPAGEESAAEAEDISAENPSDAPDGAQAGGVTKMRRRLWGSGRPWSPPKMYSRRLWGSGRPWSPPKMYRRRLWGSGRPWSPPKMYRRRLWGSGRPWSPPKMYRRRLWGSGRPWSPPKMYRRRLWGSGRPWSPPKMYSRRLYGSGRQWYP